MPFDTAYIIGVVRSQERGLLEDDEYTRMIEAPTAREALHVLVETPYRQWVDPANGLGEALSALEDRLVQVQQWLGEVAADRRVMQFIQTKYDGLNAATAWLEWQAKKPEPGPLSRLGSVERDVWHSVIWHDLGWDLLPEAWAKWLRAEKDQPADAKTARLERAGEQTLEILEQLARTPLMRQAAALARQRVELESRLRGGQPINEAVAAFAEAGLDKFNLAVLQEVQDGQSAIRYERLWDETMLERLRAVRWEPVGYDPILAFWLALELETRTIRLILSSKMQGAGSDQLRALQRTRYLAVV